MVCSSLRDIGSTVAQAESDFNMSEQSYSYIIIGAGLTGTAATEGIREVDQHGSILLFSAEKDKPYDRPPLSKQVLKGWVPADHTKLPRVRQVDAEWRLGVAATGLRPVEIQRELMTAAAR